jgi:hypothetical protein
MDATVRAIRSAKVMVLVFSENANNSDEIKREVVLAGNAKVTVIPVRVEDVGHQESMAGYTGPVLAPLVKVTHRIDLIATLRDTFDFEIAAIEPPN